MKLLRLYQISIPLSTLSLVVSSRNTPSLIFNPGPSYKCYFFQGNTATHNDSSVWYKDYSECAKINDDYPPSFNIFWNGTAKGTYKGLVPVSGTGNGTPMTLTSVNKATNSCTKYEPGFYYMYLGSAIKKDVNLSAYDRWMVEFDVLINSEDCPQCSATKQTCQKKCHRQRSSYCGGYSKQWFTVDFIYWATPPGATEALKNLISVILWNPIPSKNFVGAYAWPTGTYRLQTDAGRYVPHGIWTHVAIDFKQLLRKYSSVLCHAGAVPDIAIDNLQIILSNTNSSSVVQIKNSYVYAEKFSQTNGTVYPTPTFPAAWTPTYCSHVPGNSGYVAGTPKPTYTEWINAHPPSVRRG